MSLEHIIKKAMEKADDAQAVMVVEEKSAVGFEYDKLKEAESSQRTKINVKVIVDGKVGLSSTTDMNDVDGVVKRALEAAEFGSPANFEMPEPAELQDVKVYDPKLLELEKPEMIDMGQHMMDMIKSYNSEIMSGAGVEKSVYTVEYANSKGASYSAEHTGFSVGAGGQLVRGTDILFAGESVGQKKREIDFEDIAVKAIEYFRMAEEIVPIESGEYPVIFTPDGLVAVLLSLGLALDGKSALLGQSPLRDKVGEQIAVPGFSLTDDPFIDHGPKTSAFDNEGTPRRVNKLVENGVLQGFIYDRDTAGKAGAEPTGHGADRSPTNVVISAGDVPYEDMIKGVEKGLLVDSYLGLGQGNPINGEFSANVFLGYKIENGEIKGRVKDVMLAGNAFDALKNIAAISAEREWVSGAYAWITGLMPYVQVDKGLIVTAK